ncbi:MAG: CDP-diacylglycerol--glycerol-3-phosphate 3-phosphatidyltransferase [Desulfobacterales bacterium]|jgi:CDP-diacylglycerol--glycerol-3-phosphate 3-phosphatidyltransferase|nr:CDP-diacylglycerol--glycerol-3-phosphate 3-phosphatidyltransferase [Desulfobacterales bacterium]
MMNMLPSDKIRDILKHPNTLTLFRIIVVPGIVVLLMFPNGFSAFVAALLFSAAAITDYFDGFYARQRGMESELGKIMDPVADKLLVSCTLIMLSSLNWIPAWIVCVIIGREIAVTGLRNIISGKGEDISASSLGKYKTGFQIAAIIPLLIHYEYIGIDFHIVGMFFLWLALILTVYSGIDYFIRFKKFYIT